MKYGLISCIEIMCITMMLSFSAFAASKDNYEDDNSYEQARKIIVNLEEPQLRNFHEATDQDWIKFYGFQGRSYVIEAINRGTSDLYIELYDAEDMSEPIKIQNTPLYPLSDEILSFRNCPHNGIYYAKIRLNSSGSFSENTAYELTAYILEGVKEKTIYGVVTDAVTGSGIGDVLLITNQNMSDFSCQVDGSYKIIDHPPNDFEMYARRVIREIQEDDYLSCIIHDNLSQNENREINIGMIPVNMSGLILILQIVAGSPTNYFISWEQDIDGDGKIGLAEAVYTMQKIAQ